jgi:hypothetical protein
LIKERTCGICQFGLGSESTDGKDRKIQFLTDFAFFGNAEISENTLIICSGLQFLRSSEEVASILIVGEFIVFHIIIYS